MTETVRKNNRTLHISNKYDALGKNSTMGIPAEWLGPDGLISPDKRGIIKNEVLAAHRAYLSHLGNKAPAFFTEKPVLGLAGVEGFLQKAKYASYNTPAQSSFTGILQFGSAAFHTYAKPIAESLNAIMQNPEMANTSLAKMMQDGRVQHPFDTKNVWHVFRHPVTQYLGAAIHTASMHPRIDALLNKGAITKDQAAGLFVISHNIPALSRMVAASLETGSEKPVPENLKPLMKTNPALYDGTKSLKDILDKVSAYTSDMAKRMEAIDVHIVGAKNNVQHASLKPQDARADVSAFVHTLLNEEMKKPGVPESDRKMLEGMIKAIDDQEKERAQSATPTRLPGALNLQEAKMGGNNRPASRPTANEFDKEELEMIIKGMPVQTAPSTQPRITHSI